MYYVVDLDTFTIIRGPFLTIEVATKFYRQMKKKPGYLLVRFMEVE